MRWRGPLQAATSQALRACPCVLLKLHDIKKDKLDHMIVGFETWVFEIITNMALATVHSDNVEVVKKCNCFRDTIFAQDIVDLVLCKITNISVNICVYYIFCFVIVNNSIFHQIIDLIIITELIEICFEVCNFA